jgi:tungstate transport system substrate-binding protein
VSKNTPVVTYLPRKNVKQGIFNNWKTLDFFPAKRYSIKYITPKEGPVKLRAIVAICLGAAVLYAGAALAQTRIKCASTTSTQNSGLFDHLLPIFEKKTGIKMDVVAVGTGAAIEIGKRGDADVVMVHAKGQELKAVEEGWFKDRHDLMYNDFVIIGPTNDLLKIKGMKSAVEAFNKIGSQDKVPFVSRGDKSGTHSKELAIWKKAGLDPKR